MHTQEQVSKNGSEIARQHHLEVYIESEQKYIVHSPEAHHFEQFKQIAEISLMRQVYLSQEDEPISLRLREIVHPNGLTAYTAALKGPYEANKIDTARLEFETSITEDVFTYYTHANELPEIRKIRAHLSPALTIDWVEGMESTPIIEIEDRTAHPEDEWFFTRYGSYISKTNLPEMSMEALAHASKKDITPSVKQWSTQEVIATIDSLRAIQSPPLVVCISGRSGSGKSTLVRELMNHFENETTTVLLSTDDYHRGATWLTAYNNNAKHINWDLPIVYDTAALSNDIDALRAGHSIPRHMIDFNICERKTEGHIEPADLIFVEGLYAHSSDFDRHRNLLIELSTPLATCIWRRVLRDLTDRPQFANPADSLRYILETAEPAYRQQSNTSTTLSTKQ